MNKAEEVLELDTDNFLACWLFAEIVQFGVFMNIWLSQIGLV